MPTCPGSAIPSQRNRRLRHGRWLLLGCLSWACSPSEKLVAVVVDAANSSVRAQLAQPIKTLHVLVRNPNAADRNYTYHSDTRIALPAIFGITVSESLRGTMSVNVTASTDNPSDPTASGAASIDLATVSPDQPRDLLVPLVPN